MTATKATARPVGEVARKQVQVRTRVLALKAGRVPPHMTQADYQQAKCEVTGESDPDRQDALLNRKTAVTKSILLAAKRNLPRVRVESRVNRSTKIRH